MFIKLILSIIMSSQGQIAEAEAWFKKAQVLDKTDPAAWTHYGKFELNHPIDGRTDLT